MQDSTVAVTWRSQYGLLDSSYRKIQNRWKTNQPAYILDENVENLMGGGDPKPSRS